MTNELRRLGWRVSVDRTWTRKWRGPMLRYARVTNILAQHPSATDPPTVLLTSHYDSVPSGPGAGDASAPVAAILEALRAVGRDPAARSLGVLITDGEEAGLLGAQAFADHHPWMDHVKVVLNFEARGNSGVPWMFEAGNGAMRLVGLFGDSVPRPFANSLSTAIYRRMPNDTDYSVFRGRGVLGLNMAMIGGHPAYHSQLDTAENLDPRSLQSIGDAVLALARAVPGGDWLRTEQQPTYFNPLGAWFVIYPVQVDQAILVLGLFFGGLWLWGRTRGLVPGIVFALGAWGAVIVAVGVSWLLLTSMFPAMVDTPNEVPYRHTPLYLGWILLGMAVWGRFAGWLRDAEQAAASALVLLAVVGVLTVEKFPEATFLISWPLLTLSVAAWLTVLDRSRRWVWWTLAAIPVPLLYAPLAREALLGLTPHGAWLVAAAVGIGLFVLLPLNVQFGRTDAKVHWILAGAGVLLILASGVTAGSGESTPRPLRLAYAVPPAGEASWISRSEELDPWLSEQVIQEWIESDWSRQSFVEVGDLRGERRLSNHRPAWVARARPVEGLIGPEIEELATGSDDNGRWIDVEVRTRRRGEQLWLGFSGAVIDMVQWSGLEPEPVSDGPVREMLILAPASAETLRLWAQGTTPVWVTAYELTYGLPPGTVELPDFLIRSHYWSDFTVRVGTRVAVDDRHTAVAADS